MITNYLKIAFRNLLRNKGTSFINIIGLATGIACCILILMYVLYELGYDRYHANADRIYRVEVENWAATPEAVGPFAKATFPDVQEEVRFLNVNRALAGDQNGMFTEQQFFFADSSVFRVFDATFIAGDARTALNAPNAIVLTRAMAEKYFGKENPLGRRLKVQTGRDYDFTVTGVVENPPVQSHFRYDFLASMSSQEQSRNERMQWRASIMYTYLLLRPNADLQPIEKGIRREMLQRTGEPDTSSLDVTLRPLTDIHLYSQCEKEITPQSSIVYIYILSGIATLILLLAMINFVNLSTARAMRRAKEVAVRKTFGAEKSQLILQFIGESFLITLLAALGALVIAQLLLPQFTVLTGIQLSSMPDEKILGLALVIGLCLLVGFAAGSYPAFYLSRFQPIKILKSGATAESPSSSASLIRNSLIVFQFTISIALIIGSQVIAQQLSFIQSRKLGLDTEHVLILPVNSISGEQYSTLKNGLLSHSDVIAVSASLSVPSERIIVEELQTDGVQTKGHYLRILVADYDFAETYGLKIEEGRTFSRAFVADSAGAFLLNEKAIPFMEIANPLGKSLVFSSLDRKGPVVGIIDDFNFASLRSEIEPLAIALVPNPRFFKYISIRLGKGDKQEAISTVAQAWKSTLGSRPFEYQFLDEKFGNLYKSEMKLRSIVTAFTIVGIVIACLGLIGLVSQVVEQRTKEIGIRKVLGASVGGIVGLISKEFLKFVLIANVIAWPVAYFLLKKWLEDFAFKIDLGAVVFLVAGAAALTIAFVTISIQAMKAALANPIDAVRYE